MPFAPLTEVAGGARYSGQIPANNLTLPYCTEVWIQRFVRFVNELQLIQIHTVDTRAWLLCPQCLFHVNALDDFLFTYINKGFI